MAAMTPARPAPERAAALPAPAVGMAVGYSVGLPGAVVTPPVGATVVGVATVELGYEVPLGMTVG